MNYLNQPTDYPKGSRVEGRYYHEQSAVEAYGYTYLGVVPDEAISCDTPGMAYMVKVHRQYGVQMGGIRALREAEGVWKLYRDAKAAKGFVEPAMLP